MTSLHFNSEKRIWSTRSKVLGIIYATVQNHANALLNNCVGNIAYMKIIEQWGSGIPRWVENCKSAGLREPELLEIGGSFRVKMFRKTELMLNDSGKVYSLLNHICVLN